MSDRLTDSPCCLVVPEGGSHAFVERLLRERGRNVPHAKRILEVNPSHPIIQHLRTLQDKEPSSPQLTEWVLRGRRHRPAPGQPHPRYTMATLGDSVRRIEEL